MARQSASPWFETLTARTSHMSDHVLTSTECKAVCSDLSQIPGRSNDTMQNRINGDYVPCVTPRGIFWMWRLLRPLQGDEALALQQIALKPGLRKDISEEFKQDLAGNAFNGATVAAVLLSVLVAIARASTDMLQSRIAERASRRTERACAADSDHGPTEDNCELLAQLVEDAGESAPDDLDVCELLEQLIQADSE